MININILQEIKNHLISSKYENDKEYYITVEKFLILNYGFKLNFYDFQEIYNGENHIGTIQLRHTFEDEVIIEDIVWESE